MTDMVNHPPHYQGKDGLEVLDVVKSFLTEQEYKGAVKYNIIRYGLRAGRKDDELQDVQKMIFFAKEWEKLLQPASESIEFLRHVPTCQEKEDLFQSADVFNAKQAKIATEALKRSS